MAGTRRIVAQALNVALIMAASEYMKDSLAWTCFIKLVALIKVERRHKISNEYI